MLVDSHSHINTPPFAADRNDVVQRALEQDVSVIIDVGCDVPSSQSAIENANTYPGIVFPTAGLHPEDVLDAPEDWLEQIRVMGKNPQVIAIGEIGLDYYRDHTPKDIQREVFLQQVALARELDLPVIIHTRESHRDLIGLLHAHGNGIQGVFHCFSGDIQAAKECLDLGFYISFAGPLTYKNSTLPEVAQWAPLDRILLETDSPYLTPHPMRGQRNEPARVQITAERLAQEKGMALEEVAEITTVNAFSLFRLAEKGARMHTNDERGFRR